MGKGKGAGKHSGRGVVADVATLLGAAKTIYLIDWPSREVPDTLARAGYTVVSNDGPDKHNAYEVKGNEVRVRDVGRQPDHADIVYAHRPIEELPGIVDAARSMGAKAIWIQSARDQAGARDPRGCWMPKEDSARAREIVEIAGLMYIESPYIADAAGPSRH